MRTVTCERCQGLMVREVLRTARTKQTRHTTQTGRQPSPWLWRCYCCGERVDRVILLARAEQAAMQVWQREAEERDLHEWSAWLGRVTAGVALGPTP